MSPWLERAGGGGGTGLGRAVLGEGGRGSVQGAQAAEVKIFFSVVKVARSERNEFKGSFIKIQAGNTRNSLTKNSPKRKLWSGLRCKFSSAVHSLWN